MIQKLILKMIDLLVETLAGEIPNPAQHIKANDPANSLDIPLIVLTPGRFKVIAQPGEITTTTPQPEEIRQKFAVNQITPSGLYLLTKTPLQGSVRCKVFLNEGTVSERQIWLQEKQDFTINYATKQCSFIYNLSSADSFLLIYSFVNVSILRGFTQELSVDIYASNSSDVEKLVSLMIGTIIVNHDALIIGYNQDPLYTTIYNAGSVGTYHQLSQIQFLEGTPEQIPALKTSLNFLVSGQIRATREITEGFGLIEKIHSPGRISDQPIDIFIQVE
jgi:hypothetical protein